MPDRVPEETIQLALTALALCGDSPTRAVKMLKTGGVTVSRTGLRKWADEDPERYEKIRDTRAAEIEKSVARKALALADRYSDLEGELIDEIRKQLAAGTLRDPSSASRNASVSRGISVDKLLVLGGRPSVITEHRSGDDIIRALTEKGYVDVSSIDDVAPPVELLPRLPPAA